MALNIDNPVVNGNPDANFDNASPSSLSNPIIMDKVFGYLTINEVKTARAVCKFWDLIGTACLGRRCFLSINKFVQCCQDDAKTGSLLPLSINDLLVRMVKIDNTLVGGGLDVGKKIDYDFLTFVLKRKEQIEEIKFKVNRHFAPTIKWVLENVHFSKLKTIQLDEKSHDETSIAGYGWDSFDFLNFLPMPNLTMVKISAPENMKGRDGGNRVDEKDGFPYYQIIQEIINKSPNLEKLEIGENFYPDLSRCRKLKLLSHSGHPLKPFEIRQDFDLSKMLKMLHQVKNTLENLAMSTYNTKYYRGKILDRLGIPEISLRDTDIKFPCFPCLKSLLIYPVEAYYVLGCGFEEGTKNLLPSLKKLTLLDLSRESSSLAEIILGLKTCWTNVEHLSLDGFLRYEVDDPNILINKIAKTFPNTNFFSTFIKGDLETEPSSIIFQRFKYALSAIALADWNVEYLEIYIGFRCTVSKLMDALGEVVSLDGFKKLKNLTLSFPSSLIALEDGSINFEKIFTALPSITFRMIKFKGSTFIKMAKFIERHNLNIQFLDVD